MIPVIIAAAIFAYLTVGGIVGRILNERRWRSRGLGHYVDYHDRLRTHQDEAMVHVGVALATMIFWPFLALGMIVVTVAVAVHKLSQITIVPLTRGLGRIILNLFVPTDLRRKL